MNNTPDRLGRPQAISGAVIVKVYVMVKRRALLVYKTLVVVEVASVNVPQGPDNTTVMLRLTLLALVTIYLVHAEPGGYGHGGGFGYGGGFGGHGHG